MKILVCKNNIVGFFSAVYNSFYVNKDADSVTSNQNSIRLDDEIICVDEDLEIAAKVRTGLLKRYGREAYDYIYEAYHSDSLDKEEIIFSFIKLLIKSKGKALKMYNDEIVLNFFALHDNVSKDLRRIIQFVRLQEMENGIFYAPFVSKHDVIELVLPHFMARYNTLHFILHDKTRSKMIFYDGKGCHYGYSPPDIKVVFSDEEKQFRSIWKNYVKNIAIPERRNLKTQAAFMPHFYRVFMHEQNEE